MDIAALLPSIRRFTLVPLALLVFVIAPSVCFALEQTSDSLATDKPAEVSPKAMPAPPPSSQEGTPAPFGPPRSLGNGLNGLGGGGFNNQERFLSVKPKKLTPEEHAKALHDLYEQLEASTNKDLAQVLERAIERLWMKSGSDTVDLLMGRAIGAVQMKDYDLALGVLDRVTALAPDYTEAWNKRAWVHYMNEDYLSSMDDLRQVLSRDPRHFKAIHGLSLVFRQLGIKRAALKAIRKALTLHPFLEEGEEAEETLSRDVEGQGI